MASLAAFAESATGAPISLEGLTGAYSPGGVTTFEVVVPELANLGAYNIDLTLSSTEGTAGVDFFFNLAATKPATSQYVFPSTFNFFDAVNLDSPSTQRLTLSDFDFTGVDVVAGVNDRIATVWIGTLAGFTGDLDLAFDVTGLFLDTPDTTPTPVAGFAQISADTDAQGVVTLSLIPEPSSALTMTLGAMLVLAGCRRHSKCAPSSATRTGSEERTNGPDNPTPAET